MGGDSYFMFASKFLQVFNSHSLFQANASLAESQNVTESHKKGCEMSKQEYKHFTLHLHLLLLNFVLAHKSKLTHGMQKQIIMESLYFIFQGLSLTATTSLIKLPTQICPCFPLQEYFLPPGISSQGGGIFHREGAGTELTLARKPRKPMSVYSDRYCPIYALYIFQCQCLVTVTGIALYMGHISLVAYYVTSW